MRCLLRPTKEATMSETKEPAEGGAGIYHVFEDGVRVYHERQRLQLCLLHALNNLLQGVELFSKRALDGIADELESITAAPRWWNPYRMVFRTHRNLLMGNYDANVLFQALDLRHMEGIWYDRRGGADGFNPMATHGSRFVGIIVNIPVARYGRFMRIWRGRHWVALRVIHGYWYNLDSDLPFPIRLANGEDELKMLLDGVFVSEGEVIIVVEKDRPESPAAPNPSGEYPSSSGEGNAALSGLQAALHRRRMSW